MDLNLLYHDFIMDDRELMFSSAPGTVPSFHDKDGNTYCAVPVYQHLDPDLVCDPLSTNRRLPETVDLVMFGTLVVICGRFDAGPHQDVDTGYCWSHNGC